MIQECDKRMPSVISDMKKTCILYYVFINAFTYFMSNQYHLRYCKLLPRMVCHKHDRNKKEEGKSTT